MEAHALQVAKVVATQHVLADAVVDVVVIAEETVRELVVDVADLVVLVVVQEEVYMFHIKNQ